MKRRSLRNVTSTHGRADVLFYRLAERYMETIESQHGLVGLREHLLPIVEDVIVERFPPENLIPSELRSMVQLLDQNLRRRGC